jgi:protein-S-isoprenylcysteine O-methyltransferase Ste14
MDLVIYLLCAGMIALAAFVIFRIIVRRDYRRKGRTTAAPELLVCILYMAFPSTYLPPDWYLLPATGILPLQRAIALVLILTGVTLTVFAMFFVLGVRRAMGWQVDKLVDSGPYRLIRNP